MQNKPNLLDAQMNINLYNTTYYENFIPLGAKKQTQSVRPALFAKELPD